MGNNRHPRGQKPQCQSRKNSRGDKALALEGGLILDTTYGPVSTESQFPTKYLQPNSSNSIFSKSIQEWLCLLQETLSRKVLRKIKDSSLLGLGLSLHSGLCPLAFLCPWSLTSYNLTGWVGAGSNDYWGGMQFPALGQLTVALIITRLTTPLPKVEGERNSPLWVTCYVWNHAKRFSSKQYLL